MSCSPKTELVDGLGWRFAAMRDPDFSSKYSLGKALLDLSGIGALYNLGIDHACLDRTDRSIAWIRGIKPALTPSDLPLAEQSQQLFENEKSSLSRSILSKIAYLGSLGVAMAGYMTDRTMLGHAGALSAFAIGAGLLMKAGADSVGGSRDDQIQFLDSIRSQIQVAR
jgi:hypothetical protein